jgi:membrane protease YdiL (CAAX protease family)
MDPLSLPAEAAVPLAVAPAWHTIVLVLGILAFSIHGASRFSAANAPIHRLATYGLTACAELAMLGWTVLGLRLRKTPLRSLLGPFSLSFRSIAVDVGVALLFWIGSLVVLGAFAVAWETTEAVLAHRLPASTAGQHIGADPAQRQALRALAQLAPSNGEEIAAWTLLCIVAGFAEEVAFRGYLQRQFIAWARGRVPAGVVFSALCFGAAHAYEGVRGMFLIAVFGALFSLLALYRRTLRPGILAHAGHDFAAGLALALLKSLHFI